MSTLSRFLLAICVLISVLSASVLFGSQSNKGASDGFVTTNNLPTRGVTVADAIRMTRFADPHYAAGGASKDLVANFSPDGKRFVVVLKKGNLEQNTNEYSLLLFRASDVFHSGTPRVLTSFASSSNRPAIKTVRWLDDNETILFLGEHAGKAAQVYSIKCSSGQLQRLTRHRTNIMSFTATPHGDRIIYAAEATVSSVNTWDVRRNGVRVTRELLSDLIRGQTGGGEGPYPDQELYVQKLNIARPVHLNGQINLPDVEMWVSPDGRYVVVQTETGQVKKEWNGYEDTFLHVLIGNKTPNVRPRIYQYELIDTRTRLSQILLDTPIRPNWGSEAAWSPDSQSVVVSDVYVPLDVGDSAELMRRKSRTFLVEIKVPSQESKIISDADIRLIKWDPRTNYLVCELGRMDSRRGKAVRKILFRKAGHEWFRVDTGEEAPQNRPEIILEENLNTPPRIVAVDSAEKKKVLLFDLNPQFANLSFGKVEEITWKDKAGDDRKGGLYWPPGYITGAKYPLVIQTHGWTLDKFWIDGPFTTAFAAQPLANRGFFVLQDSSPEGRFWDTSEEGPRAMAAYEGAIDYLDRRGLIDVNRVALIGFSRTCFHVTYTLTHSKYHFAAAAIVDGIDAGYFQYMAFANYSPPMSNEYDLLNGAPPVGDGLSLWMKRSPPFLMDRIRTPVRVQAIGPTSLLYEWNWYSGLSRLGKPVELIYIPDGTHILEKPWNRLVSQEGNVDWFRFWLKGEEDPDPAKADQYARWRELREMQCASVKPDASSR